VQEIIGDLWDFYKQPYHTILITTNGTIKSDGSVVMGRGCAKEAADRFPRLPKILGKLISEGGNHIHFIPSAMIYSFPVKHNWWEKADLELIRQSAEELARLAWPGGFETNYILPRPGCGNGGRDWETEVKPILEPILPKNVKVISSGR